MDLLPQCGRAETIYRSFPHHASSVGKSGFSLVKIHFLTAVQNMRQRVESYHFGHKQTV